MSNTPAPAAVDDEVDLEADVNFPEDEYLEYLVDRAPASSVLLDEVKTMPIYKGMVCQSTDPAKPHPNKLSKAQVESMLSPGIVAWEDRVWG